MTALFCVRPATRNIGNDAINRGVAMLLQDTFGIDVGIVNIPALVGPQFGGFSSRQVYDMNRLAHGVVLGGGNLFENGQISIDKQALAALQPPMMMIGLSYGRIFDVRGELSDRTDALHPDLIRQLAQKSMAILMRDRISCEHLNSIGVSNVELAGCPTMFLPETPAGAEKNETILVSVRHPGRMSVPAPLQWRVADQVRSIIAAIESRYGKVVKLACHDYADIEFASAFDRTEFVYYDDVHTYFAALRSCRFNVTYPLHAFLPCLAFGTPSLHLSYDERGKNMIETADMADWNVDLMARHDVTAAVMDKIEAAESFQTARKQARPTIERFRKTTIEHLKKFKQHAMAHRLS
ncbi:MAG: polysaccharide pyruvyl transferase family protein [Hyphomonadaceae bacterium]|nr:polysaccharide pyruvyl transferase family protein [Hyphomonadaceae bacterium]